MKYVLAIDIGASSGRHIVGWPENGGIGTEEVYRFPNGVTDRNGHLAWDTEALLYHVKAGIEKALEKYPAIESLSVDTWAVDYVLMRGDAEVLPCHAYRDSRTKASVPRVHERIPFSELYRRTGIQFQPFNTIYQLYADKMAGRLEGVTGFLMVPEYLMYKLCGTMSHEYTNATTGGMVSAVTGAFVDVTANGSVFLGKWNESLVQCQKIFDVVHHMKMRIGITKPRQELIRCYVTVRRLGE